jgi:hypothetical protein
MAGQCIDIPLSCSGYDTYLDNCTFRRTRLGGRCIEKDTGCIDVSGCNVIDVWEIRIERRKGRDEKREGSKKRDRIQ